MIDVIRVECAAEDPDLWLASVNLRISRRMLAEVPWWRPWLRRALLEHVARLEDEVRELLAKADARALERTRAAVLP